MIPNIQKGFRGKLDEHVALSSEINIELAVAGPAVYDFSCFGVDANNKLSDDRYMVFYNQTSSPGGEIVFIPNVVGATYRVALSKLPASINKLVFTVSIDGNDQMSSVNRCSLKVAQNGADKMSFELSGKDFQDEKAVIMVEIYRKDVWRIAAVGSGFNGGLGDLLKAYGGEEATPAPVPPSIPAQPPSLQKISLKKGEKISLAKNVANTPVIVENGWTAYGKDYDLKALVRYRNGKTIYVGAANSDERLQTPEGAVKHGGDVVVAGDLERIMISWHPDIASVAVSSYSALENGTGSFREYGVYVRIKIGILDIMIPAAVTSDNSQSYTLCFGEIVFGDQPGQLDVYNLELYSAPESENRIGYRGGKVTMDIGPVGQQK